MENNKEIIKTAENKQQIINENVIIDYLKSFGLMSNLKDNEVKQCTEISKAFQLNPFKREIHFVAYQGINGRQLSIIVGYETYLKRAERSGKLAGWRVWTDGNIKDGSLKAICEIHRKDWTTPLRHEVYFTEYVRQTQIWREKPYTMLKKIAIAQAFRLAFPDELGGMPYTQEEQWENGVIEAVIETEKKETDVKEIKTEQKQEIKEEQKNDKVDNNCYSIIKDVSSTPGLDCEIEKKNKKDGTEYLVLKLKSPKMTFYTFDKKLFDKILKPEKEKIDIYYSVEEKAGKEWNMIKDIK